MQRIYYSEKLSASLSFPKTHPIYHQFSRVLRSRIGDRVVFFNGSGQDIVYEIHEISKSNIELVQKNIIEKSPDRLTQISLYQALPNKLEKLEYILQK